MNAVAASSPSGSRFPWRSHRRAPAAATRRVTRSIRTSRVAIVRTVYFRPYSFRKGAALADHSKKSFEPNSNVSGLLGKGFAVVK